ncbi:MAG: biotin transporter BioY [Clostridia bacterium]|nr:biotin transporter BioY [Clostridia bacterium]
MKRSLRGMCEIALGAVFLALGAWIAVPLTPPFTMQTFALCCLGFLLGGRKTLAATGLYLSLGIIGLPVFAGWQSGVGVLFGPTGGFLLGFLAFGLIGCIPAKTPALRTLRAAAGLAACYVFGTAWFMLIYNKTAAGFAAAVMTCVVPFIVPDAVKLVLAAAVCKRLEPHLNRLSKR